MFKQQERVVVTGMALVTPIGITLQDFWDNSIQGKSGVSRIKHFSIPDHMSQIAGIISHFADKDNENDRLLQFAEYAISNCLADSKLNSDIDHYCHYGLYLSSAVSQIATMEKVFRIKSQEGKVLIDHAAANFNINEKDIGFNPFDFSSLTAQLSKKFGFGKHMLIPTGCAGGVDAISYAVHAIRNHKHKVVITGGVEAPITPLVVAAFSKISATTNKFNHDPEHASRPFDKDRDGFVLGEGCGILQLESLSHALERNAKIYAEIIGSGSVNNCYHMTNIPQDGRSIAQSCKLALQDAKLNPEEIDFINAHGSSTPQNDIAETNAFNLVFGHRAKQIPVTSIKSQIGHSLAASNAIEIISAIMTINTSIIPPTINLFNQDHACTLNIVSNKAQSVEVNSVLKTSSGFSGIHSSLILKKFRV